MAQITRQHADTIVSGSPALASDINDELNSEVNESNGQDTRITAIESGNDTLSGNKTFSGNNTHSGTNTFSGPNTFSSHFNLGRAGDQGSPAAGDVWFNTTTGLFEAYDTAQKTIALDGGVNAQTGTTYTVLTGDRNKLITLSNASAIAVTLPQAGSAGFTANWKAKFSNLGAGTVTITPTTATIDGAATITLLQNQSIEIFSDGTNYFTTRGRGVFSTPYDSGSQTITAAGSLTLAHGLPAQPKLILCSLKCTTTELNYSVGDEVNITGQIDADTNSRGCIVVPDATNLNVRFGSLATSTFAILNKTTGVWAGITNTKWALIVRAWV